MATQRILTRHVPKTTKRKTDGKTIFHAHKTDATTTKTNN